MIISERFRKTGRTRLAPGVSVIKLFSPSVADGGAKQSRRFVPGKILRQM
jgi:hypothetical protein